MRALSFLLFFNNTSTKLLATRPHLPTTKKWSTVTVYVEGDLMHDMNKYLIWLVVAALILGGGFFVYKKMYASTTTPIETPVGQIAN